MDSRHSKYLSAHRGERQYHQVSSREYLARTYTPGVRGSLFRNRSARIRHRPKEKMSHSVTFATRSWILDPNCLDQFLTNKPTKLLVIASKSSFPRAYRTSKAAERGQMGTDGRKNRPSSRLGLDRPLKPDTGSDCAVYLFRESCTVSDIRRWLWVSSLRFGT
ncbi:hypothetical protein BDW62DRAFT_174599 [Aspergillus aurantiobrunneus]